MKYFAQASADFDNDLISGAVGDSPDEAFSEWVKNCSEDHYEMHNLDLVLPVKVEVEIWESRELNEDETDPLDDAKCIPTKKVETRTCEFSTAPIP